MIRRFVPRRAARILKLFNKKLYLAACSEERLRLLSPFVRALSASAAIALTALTLMTFAVPAHAGLLVNGSFENVTGATSSFSISKDATLNGWAATPNGNQVLDCLIFAGATTNLCGTSAFGGGMSFWSFPGASPDGGKYVAVDGDQGYSTPLTQTVSGLVVGTVYSVTFYQAAAQQSGFSGATTERWQVSLGNSTQLSSLMQNADHGSVGWMNQTLSFTATSTSELLSFMAVGTPNGQPPFVLLDGVSVQAVPEPTTFAMLGLALLAIPLARKISRQRP